MQWLGRLKFGLRCLLMACLGFSLPPGALKAQAPEGEAAGEGRAADPLLKLRLVRGTRLVSPNNKSGEGGLGLEGTGNGGGGVSEYGTLSAPKSTAAPTGRAKTGNGFVFFTVAVPCRVLLDGVLQGTVTTADEYGLELPPGKYRLEFIRTADGKRTHTPLHVKSGETLRVVPKWE